MRQEKERETRETDIHVLESAMECWEAIKDNADAVNAITRFHENGCDWVMVLALVNEYCCYPRDQFKSDFAAAKGNWAAFGRRITRHEKKLLKLLEEMKSLFHEITDCLPLDAENWELDLEVYLEMLWCARTLVPKYFDPEIKPTMISFLYHLAKVSKTQPWAKRLTDLIAARSGNYFDQDSLKIAVQRIKRRSPELDSVCAKEAESHYAPGKSPHPFPAN